MTHQFDHERLRVYQASVDVLAWLESLHSEIPRKVSAREHLLRASAGIPVSIAEASGTFSMRERRQFIETAYGSSLECAACLDVLCLLDWTAPSTAQTGKRQLKGIVSMLIGFRESTARRVREDEATCETGNAADQAALFDHERLDVYRRASDVVRWCNELRKKHCLARSVEMVLDRASTGLMLNIAEGNGKFSMADRCRFIGYARTAALQAAANLDVIAVRDLQLKGTAEEGKGILADCVRMLVAWQRRLSNETPTEGG